MLNEEQVKQFKRELEEKLGSIETPNAMQVVMYNAGIEALKIVLGESVG